jgi:hypothetical protein
VEAASWAGTMREPRRRVSVRGDQCSRVKSLLRTVLFLDECQGPLRSASKFIHPSPVRGPRLVRPGEVLACRRRGSGWVRQEKPSASTIALFSVTSMDVTPSHRRFAGGACQTAFRTLSNLAPQEVGRCPQACARARAQCRVRDRHPPVCYVRLRTIR